jgi:hypothetical protein
MRQSPARRWVLLRFSRSRLPYLCGVVLLIDRCAWESNAKYVSCVQQGDCLCLPEEAVKERGRGGAGGGREREKESEKEREKEREY